ncbi:S8 family serine peptidase [Aureicoccus marinus]|uniref:S8 family serine peptidase n=1 Tax=Aureicoccus marinus TaxID=754435 RepID=UPI0015E4514F|nr:S8 family serine peptidase [Aureicoccus marinus]
MVSIPRHAQLSSPPQGRESQVGIWDAGAVLDSHQEISGRVFQWDQSTDLDNHTTQVASVLLAQGLRSEAQGMLPQGQGRVYDWNADKLEVAEAAAEGLRISNHSYGIKSENVPDWYFGCYIAASRDWDAVMYAAKNYLLVNAAGNSRGLAHNAEPLYGTPQEGFDELLGFSVSKNSLTVGSARLEWEGNYSVEGSLNSYSTIGPTDDGRIKPDLISDGTLLEAASANGNQAYGTASGTSMAAPAVSGGLLLLQEYAQELDQGTLSAASLKGLALHTATEINGEGPDYQMGWGAFNALNGIHFLQQLNYSSALLEENLERGGEHRMTLEAIGDQPLRVSISWTDPPGEAQRLVANKPVAALIHDLDIRLYQNGQEFQPWVLNRLAAESPAFPGDNRVDPYEQIEVFDPQGSFELVVRHKGELLEEVQTYSLLISGARFSDCRPQQPRNVEVLSLDSQQLTLAWSSAGTDQYRIAYRQLGEQWQYEEVQGNQHRFDNLSFGGFYEFQVYALCGLGYGSNPSEPLVIHYQEDSLAPLSNGTTGPRIFPNPAGAFLMTSVSMADKNYQIVNSAGTVVMKGKNEGSINTSLLSSGLYFLQVKTEGDDWAALKFYKE